MRIRWPFKASAHGVCLLLLRRRLVEIEVNIATPLAHKVATSREVYSGRVDLPCIKTRNTVLLSVSSVFSVVINVVMSNISSNANRYHGIHRTHGRIAVKASSTSRETSRRTKNSIEFCYEEGVGPVKTHGASASNTSSWPLSD